MYKGIMHSVVVLLLSGMYLPAQAESFNINPGMWETTYESKVTGGPPQMGAMLQQAPEVERECIKDSNYDFSPDDMDKSCNFEPTKHSDKKLTWKMSCKDQNGNTNGHGEVVFNGDTISGWSEMKVDNGTMGVMNIRDTFQGKRVGACE